MERLAERAAIPAGARVLDIGCGLGGSAFWLADEFGCDVTGMTIKDPVPEALPAASQKVGVRGRNDRITI